MPPPPTESALEPPPTKSSQGFLLGPVGEVGGNGRFGFVGLGVGLMLTGGSATLIGAAGVLPPVAPRAQLITACHGLV